MHATTYPLLTATERADAIDTVSRHFTEVIADALLKGDPAGDLARESTDWATDHQLTNDRIDHIRQWAHPDEWLLVARYLAEGRP